ncbi:hypothetical protein SRHO_G00234830 [Serrasalmus rhombeus]
MRRHRAESPLAASDSIAMEIPIAVGSNTIDAKLSAFRLQQRCFCLFLTMRRNTQRKARADGGSRRTFRVLQKLERRELVFRYHGFPGQRRQSAVVLHGYGDTPGQVPEGEVLQLQTDSVTAGICWPNSCRVGLTHMLLSLSGGEGWLLYLCLVVPDDVWSSRLIDGTEEAAHGRNSVVLC